MESKQCKSARDKLLLQLRSGTKTEMLAAMNELAKMKLCKNEIITNLLEHLNSGDPDIRREVCLVLAKMNASMAERGLIECLDDRDKKVAEAAHKALVDITGKNLSSDIEEWRK